MASKHLEGEKWIMMRFTLDQRGRLFPYRQGAFRPLRGDAVVQVGHKGVPDLIGFLFDGRAAFVEVKTAAYPTFSKEQEAFMRVAAKYGCYCAVVREDPGLGWREYEYGQAGFWGRQGRLTK